MTDICIAHGGDVSRPSGGTDRVTAIARGLQRRGFDVTLVVPEPDGPPSEHLAEVDTYPVSTDGLSEVSVGRAARIARKAHRVAEREDAQLQFEHSTLAGIATLVGISEYVLDMHDLGYARFDHVQTPASPVLKRIVRWLERRAVQDADDIVVVSEYMRAALEDWGIDSEDVAVVPNGFFPERIELARDVQRVDGRVCFLGTLHPKVDIRALGEIATLPAVSELIIVGDGALRDRVDSLAETHESVRAMGRLPDSEAFELLGNADVAINPQSSSELQRSSSPVKLYYYAALGLPMVVTPGPSVVDELVELDAAVAARTDDFADSVASLLENRNRREALAANARDAAIGFRWERRAEAFAQLYDPSSISVPGKT